MRRYLTRCEVEEAQVQQLQLYGGGDPGVLKEDMLISAIESARATWGGQPLLHTRFDVAAKYLKSFLFNHAFHNGNKRIAVASALIFLYLNGLRIEAPSQELTDLVLGCFEPRDEEPTASKTARSGDRGHRIEMPEMVRFFKQHARRVPCDDSAAALEEAHRWMHGRYAETFAILAL